MATRSYVPPKSIFELPAAYFANARSVVSVQVAEPVAQIVGPHGTANLAALDEHADLQLDVADTRDRHTCNTCEEVFDDTVEQRAHFKSDWHRLNVKRQLSGRLPITETAFESALQSDDVESISGSESDEEDRPPGAAPRAPRTFFVDAEGRHFSVWKCLLQGHAPGTSFEANHATIGGTSGADLETALRDLSAVQGARWVVLLASGGHFAGAVFQVGASKAAKGRQGGGGEQGVQVLAHRTFHRYVIRAKAGGRQSTKDGAGGKKIKSAGSSLRRHNEAALERDIKEQMRAWAGHLQEARLVFVHALGVNGNPIFAGDDAPLHRSDPRLRKIPFLTRRPTFSEAQRVASTLAQIKYEDPPAPPTQAGVLDASVPPTPTRAAVDSVAALTLKEKKITAPSMLSESDIQAAREKAEKNAAKKARDKARKQEKKRLETEAAAAQQAAQELVRSEAAVIEVAQACTQSTGSSVLERLRAAKEDKLRAQAEKQAQGARCAREERAAAAERRLAALKGNNAAGDSAGPRCDNCGQSLVGHTPFHRLQYMYCTTACVRGHMQTLSEA